MHEENMNTRMHGLEALVMRLLDEVLGEHRRKLDLVLAETKTLTQLEQKMSVQFDALTAAVQRNTTVDDSVIELLKGLASQIASLKTDPAKLQALADELNAKSDAVAAAVTENTPSA